LENDSKSDALKNRTTFPKASLTAIATLGRNKYDMENETELQEGCHD
jgi:hypothetical protein